MEQTFWKMTLLGIGALIASSTLVKAQQNCAPRDIVVERLARAFGESRRSIGLGSNNTMVEVYAAPNTGTWTITVTNPAGLTCLVASGQAYESFSGDAPETSDGA